MGTIRVIGGIALALFIFELLPTEPPIPEGIENMITFFFQQFNVWADVFPLDILVEVVGIYLVLEVALYVYFSLEKVYKLMHR